MAEWALAKEPYTRTDRSQTNAFRNGLDLMFNLRGIGWSWGKSTPLPDHPSGKKSPSAFMLQHLHESTMAHIAHDAVLYAIQSFGPTTIATPAGSSILDPNLPFLQRHARAILITLLQCTSTVLVADELYSIVIITAFCIPGAHRVPALWPPLHGPLWRVTSLQ